MEMVKKKDAKRRMKKNRKKLMLDASLRRSALVKKLKLAMMAKCNPHMICWSGNEIRAKKAHSQQRTIQIYDFQ